MRRSTLYFLLLCFFVGLFPFLQEVWAEDGVTDNLVLLGVQGPTGSFSGDEENFGMELVIKRVNDQGGIHGRRLGAHGYPKSKDSVAHGYQWLSKR